AACNIRLSIVSAGSAVEGAATRKELKYSDLMSRYTFVPIAIETMGTISTSGSELIDEIGKRSHSLSGDNRERTFLWQRLSMPLQRYNSICFNGTFPDRTTLFETDYFSNHSLSLSLSLSLFLSFSLSLSLSLLYYFAFYLF